MSKDEEGFSLHWGLISLFGNDPISGGDSWGAFTDQAPYVSMGESPFITPPLPMWGMVYWTKAFDQKLPITRTLSALIAALGLIGFYFIAKYVLPSEFSMFAPGFLAGSLIWNGFARQATSEIWGITILIAIVGTILFYSYKKEKNILHSILYSVFLAIGISLLSLSSFSGFGLALMIIPMLVILLQPTLLFSVLTFAGLSIGTLTGLSWYYSMDFPFWSQVRDSLFTFHHLFDQSLLQSVLSDLIFFPFVLVGLISFAFTKSNAWNKAKWKMHAFLAFWLLISTLATSHFSQFSIVPLILFGLSSIEQFNEHISKASVRWLVLTSTYIIALFGIIPRLPHAAINILSGSPINLIGIIAAIILIFIPIAGFLLPKRFLDEYNARMMVSLIMILFIASMVKITFANYLGKQAPQSQPAQFTQSIM